LVLVGVESKVISPKSLTSIIVFKLIFWFKTDPEQAIMGVVVTVVKAKVSRAAELPSHPLLKLYVTVSRHTASII